MTAPRLLIADDHPTFRRGLRDAIERAGAGEIVAEAGDGASAMRLAALHAPDVALLDLAMPQADGLAVLAWAREALPAMRCVLLTMYADAAYVDRAMALGARGYLLKDDPTEDVLRCLAEVARGGRFVSPRIGAPRVVPPPLDEPEDARRLALLTPAQRAVLRLLADYRTSKEIAQTLGISHRTVQNHRARICETLGLEGPHKLLEFSVAHRGRLGGD